MIGVTALKTNRDISVGLAKEQRGSRVSRIATTHGRRLGGDGDCSGSKSNDGEEFVLHV
jgi:hypothetical protein